MRIRIGSRGSALALWQAQHVRDALLARDPTLQLEIEIIRTRGDRDRRRQPPESGRIGFFTHEIEAALLEGRADIAVHSLKDLPTAMPEGLVLGGVPARGDVADALVSRDGLTLESLPRGATVLTGSPRRRALLLGLRPDLHVRGVRGNVPTRIRKMSESDAAAVVLAAAGLERLGLVDRIAERFDPASFVPACGQGALAVQVRRDDSRVAALCEMIEDAAARLAVEAERAFLAALGGGCSVPAGAYARLVGPDGRMAVTGLVAAPNGSRLARETIEDEVGTHEGARALGVRLAEALGEVGPAPPEEGGRP